MCNDRPAVCGICGATGLDDRRSIDNMNERMVHRGPDDSGVLFEPDWGVGLGARRLKVIDIVGGHQPLANEDQTVWAVLNGEIYNFNSLRNDLLARGHRFSTRSDTEVLVHLYEERGEELVHDLEGMFALAVWDNRKSRIVLARDRFGEKPLFYSELHGTLTFASELTALLAGLNNVAEADPAVVDAYFVYGYVPGENSIVKGVRQVRPGHRLVWDVAAGSGSLSRYWRPLRSARANHEGSADLVDRAHESLERSIASRLVADVPLGVFLSGGIDSTLVAAIARQHVTGALKTFTVDYDVGAVGEGSRARSTARTLDTAHNELVLSTADIAQSVPMLARLDQPIADPALVPLTALAEFARAEVTVAVGGEGADELFCGYPRYRWLSRSERASGIEPVRLAAAAAARLVSTPRLGRVTRLRDLFGPGTTFDRNLAWVSSNRAALRSELYGSRLGELAALKPGLDATLGVDFGNGDVVGSLMNLDQAQWLPDDVLAKADRASMSASLELRTPYLSRELVEFAATVPSAIHAAGGGKSLLRAVLKRTLPRFDSDRAKVAFRVPLREWLSGPLAPVLRDQLDQSPLYRQGWFERATVSRWLDDHEQGRADRSQRLWPIFVLGCWVSGGGSQLDWEAQRRDAAKSRISIH
jgi:asparagine synthase (glutamine-hydrolysing)